MGNRRQHEAEQRHSPSSLYQLATGKLHLQGNGSNDGKHWNEEQTARISLTVHAPWWKTGVAYVIYIVLSIAIIAASIRLYIHRTRKEMERKHKEEILLLRIRNLIEQCNRYEAEQKKSPEGKNITCVHSHTEPHQTENKQDASESVFLTKAIELVEKNLHVPGYSVEQLSRDLCMERTGLTGNW